MEKQQTELSPIRFKLRYVPQIRNKDAELIFEFFMVFSRFEFALKYTGFRKVINGRVEPDWKKFGISIQDAFDIDKSPEIRRAFDYLLANQPKVQIFNGEKLEWQERSRNKNDDIVVQVIDCVKGVRNNLFHGGKFP